MATLTDDFTSLHTIYFCRQPGFKQMKILRQERHTVCFIEFEVSCLHLFLVRFMVLLIILCSGAHLHSTILFLIKSFLSRTQDVNSATNVHHTFQGAVIPSSGSVGMRIQYPSCKMILHLICFEFFFPPLCVDL